ncbi:MAG: GNAT family N-acetyltransferase [Planctomycetota bacterium]|jgi:ribosomal protein S18 acetylase RimI-like enzyme
MTGQVRIREANEDDLLGRVELWTELMDFHKRLDSIFTVRPNAAERFAGFVRDNIASDDACVFVADEDGFVVGYCHVKILEYPPVLEIERYGQIHGMAVGEEHRRRGIGARLTEAACEWLSKKGIGRVEVRHSTKNGLAEAFWRKVGFQPYLTTNFKEI